MKKALKVFAMVAALCLVMAPFAMAGGHGKGGNTYQANVLKQSNFAGGFGPKVQVNAANQNNLKVGKGNTNQVNIAKQSNFAVGCGPVAQVNVANQGNTAYGF